MAWLRLDDQFDAHPKIAELTDREFRVHIRVLCYCARYRTGGVIPGSVWRVVPGLTRSIGERFVTLGLWDRDDAGGLRVHDFEEYNSTTIEDRIRAYLEAHPNASATEIVREIGGRKQLVLSVVKRMRRFPDGSAEVPLGSRDDTESGSRSGSISVPDPVVRARSPSFKDSSLSDVDVETDVGDQQTADDERRRSWIEYAETRADVRAKAAYARKGFETGGWPPGHEQTHARPSPEVIASRWIHGHGWDETFTDEMVAEEFDRIANRHGELSAKDRETLMTEWHAERERRYPGVAA